MKEVYEAFKSQVKEISLYFAFLRRSLEEDVFLYSSKNEVKRPLNPEIHKILKANLFLILYNLTEAIIRKTVVAICDAMKNDGIHYKLSKPHIQKLFLQYKCKNLQRVNDQHLIAAIDEIVRAVLDDSILQLDETSVPISGNLDAQKIREIAKAYGFSEVAAKAKRAGSVLLTVKNQRNALAHGKSTFSECGRDYTLPQLKEIKDETICFLSGILHNVKVYIDNKEYRI